jgi:hypothetical protein
MLLSSIIMCFFSLITGDGNYNVRVITMIVIGSIYTNFLFTVSILPGKAATESFDDKKHKLIAYFLIPSAIFIVLLVNLLNFQKGDYEFHLIMIITFISTHIFLLRKTKFEL